MATNGHPATPPPSDPSANTETKRPEPEVPLTSTQDDGQTKRPRDARLIHVVLSSLGIHSYQERVPLQLLDFAYRYTSGVLSDSLRLSAEGYASQVDKGNKRNATGDDSNAISVTALRQAIASRQGYTFQGPLGKEFMMEQASERNRVALPRVDRTFGVQLPPEKYCLTGVGWGLRDEWESEEDVPTEVAPRQVEDGKEDERMGGVDGEDNDNEDEEEEGAGRMEDVFGTDAAGDTTMVQD